MSFLRALTGAALAAAFAMPVGVVMAEVLGVPKPTPLASPAFPESKEWALSGSGTPMGYAVRTPKGMTLSLLNGRETMLETYGRPYVAERSGSFVVLIPVGGDVATSWVVEFYGADGKLRERNERSHGHSVVAISDDGETIAVGGNLRTGEEKPGGEGEKTGVVIYDGAGREVGRRGLPRGAQLASMATDGKVVVIGYRNTATAARKVGRWQVEVLDRAGKVKQAMALDDAVQALRLAEKEGVLLVSVAGGVRVFSLAGKPIRNFVRLPRGHVVAGAGRLFWRNGQLLAVSESPTTERRGYDTWYLLGAEGNEFRVLAKGGVVKSRGSPAFSTSRDLGADEWPVLVDPEQIIRIRPPMKPNS